MTKADLDTKHTLDKLLVEYKVQPVGWGYIDCITTKDNVSGFVDALTEIGIHITDITHDDWEKFAGEIMRCQKMQNFICACIPS